MDPENQSLSATTVAALSYRDGALIAADRQATMTGTSDRLHEPIEKLTHLGAHSVVGVAGIPAVLDVVRAARTQFSTWERLYGRPVSPDGELRCLSLFLKEFLVRMPIPTQFVLASFDTGLLRPRVFLVAPDLAEEFRTGYVAIGSGERHAIALLRRMYVPNALYEEALLMLSDAMRMSTDANAAVGSVYSARRITRDGIADISTDLNRGGVR